MNKRFGIFFVIWIILGIPAIFADQKVIKIHHIKSKGLKIEKSGVYRFMNNIKVDLEDGKAAITIAANNVVLDLNQFTLQQKGSGQNNIGILIKAGHQSVKIQNGTIRKIHGFGIEVKENNHIVQLQDLIVQACGSDGSALIPDNLPHTGGILFLGTSALPITDVILDHVKALNNTNSNPLVAVNGLLAAEVNKLFIQDCHFSDNIGPSEITVAGAEFFRISNCVIENSHADNNFNTPDNGATASCFGFHFNETVGSEIDSTESFNIKVANTTANRTVGSVIRAAGFRFRKARNIVIENSESHQTTNTLPDPVNVDSTITGAAGFLLTVCDDFSIRNCNASEHIMASPSLRIVGGIDISRSNFGLIVDCHAAHCQNSGDGILGGFIIEPIVGRPGFDRSVGVIFENSVSEGNLGGTQGGGFALFGADEAKIISCEAINNAPYGIEVGGSFPENTMHSIIKDNIVMSNLNIGINDNTGNGGETANAYLGNIARDNPENFNIPPGNRIVDWLLSAGDQLNAQIYDNISIK